MVEKKVRKVRMRMAASQSLSFPFNDEPSCWTSPWATVPLTVWSERARHGFPTGPQLRRAALARSY